MRGLKRFGWHGLGLLTVMAVLVTPVLGADVTGNGGFEAAGGGGAADSDQWTEFGGGPVSISERDATNPNTGGFAHRLEAQGDAAAGAAAGINQNSIADVGLASLDENTTVTASFEVEALYGIGGVGTAFLRVLNGNGAIVGDSGPVGIPAGPYQTVNMPNVNVPAFGAPPNDVYAAFLEITAAAGAIPGETTLMFVDDVTIDGTLVDTGGPTVPSTSEWGLILIAMLFLVALAGVSVLRRQQHGA